MPFGRRRTSRTVPDPLELPERQALWRGALRWSAAVVVALFPIIFIVDQRVETPLSPVLPGLVVLALLIILLPLGLWEVAARMMRRREAARRVFKAERFQQTGRTAFVAALVWFGLWLALGA